MSMMNGWIIFLYLMIMHILFVWSGTRSINGIIVDEEMQRVLLDKHNALRNSLALNGISESGQPQATFMNELHWDPMLAANAQKFTDNCWIGHNNNRVWDFKSLDSPKLSTFNYDSDDLSLGENYLWYPRTSNTIYEDAVSMAEEHWWNEHLDYNYNTKYCSSVCGHYTQMAWADTRYVGCGASICPSNGYNYLFLICEYYPSGNFNGNRPYNSGVPCSECSTLASDRTVCDGVTKGQCGGCQSPDWNLCDDGWTNCDELGCPTSGSSCQDDGTQFPCEHCLRSCNGCPTQMLSPSPSCDAGFDGLSPVIIPTVQPTPISNEPTKTPTSNPVPTLPPVPTKDPSVSPTVSGPSLEIVNGIEIDLDLQKIMLDKHNTLRNNLALNGISVSNQPSATYMNELHFDKALAATAQQYTNKCYSGHNNNRKNDFKNYYGDYSAFYYDSDRLSLGENYLYYPTYGESIYELAPQFAEQHWWDEHNDYTYNTKYCSGVCGHYTQMAWANTRYVGCGATLCQDNGWEYLFLICNYYPSGNYNNNHPYPQGTPCSDCLISAPDRDKCDGINNGLCSGCQALWWNWCDNYFTNCPSSGEYNALSCPSNGCDNMDYPCDYCRRDCGACSNDKLTPSPTCIDSTILYIDLPGGGGGGGTTSSSTTTTSTTSSSTTTSTTSSSTTTTSTTTSSSTTSSTSTTTTTVKPTPTTTTTTTTDGIEWQNWWCTSYRQCYRYPIECPSGKHCNVYCRGEQTCRQATIQCADNTICNIYCSNEAACVGLTIYGENAEDVNIDTDGNYQIQLTEWKDTSGRAYTAESDGTDTSLSSDNNTSDDNNNGTYNGLIVVICLLLVLCICLLIIGFFIHTRKIKDLESKLSSSARLIEIGQTKSIDTPSIINTTKHDHDGVEPEIEVSFDMKNNTNTTQAIVAEDSD